MKGEDSCLKDKLLDGGSNPGINPFGLCEIAGFVFHMTKHSGNDDFSFLNNLCRFSLYSGLWSVLLYEETRVPGENH
jgi:hypothetical protein